VSGVVLATEQDPAGDVLVYAIPQDSAAPPLSIELHGNEVPVQWQDERRATVRLGSDVLHQLGETLERGAADALDTTSLLAGTRCVVNFGDPNATKALHVGHLRQLAIGQGLASMRAAAGASVHRQSRVGDFGRNIGEALAGYLRYGIDVPLGTPGVRGDHFIGECYARFVREHADDEVAEPCSDGALSRERTGREDEVERRLAGWRADEPESTMLFERLRNWVLAGHDITYSRLGIRMDETLLEFDHLSHGDRLTDAALALGAVARMTNGALVYETGEDGYPRLLLTRSDGFPTQHLRYIATWDAIRDACSGTSSLAVLGSEWGPLSRFTATLLSQLRSPEEVHPHVTVTHGMVVDGDKVVKSSHGDALLIDEILDRMSKSDLVQELASHCPRVTVDDLARILALSFFLGRPLNTRLSLRLADFLDERANPGVTMARAWCTAQSPEADGLPDPRVHDPAYRHLLLQSQVHRRLLRRCIERNELVPLIKLHHHLSAWYLQEPRSHRLTRVMRTVLGAGLSALGLDTSAEFGQESA
jgi:arginyl-tRNA synthetase